MDTGDLHEDDHRFLRRADWASPPRRATGRRLVPGTGRRRTSAQPRSPPASGASAARLSESAAGVERRTSSRARRGAESGTRSIGSVVRDRRRHEPARPCASPRNALSRACSRSADRSRGRDGAGLRSLAPASTSFLRSSRTLESSGTRHRLATPWMPHDGSLRVSPVAFWLKAKAISMHWSELPDPPSCRVGSCTMQELPLFAAFTGCVCSGRQTATFRVSPV